MRLSEAIRLGAMLKPQTTLGYLVSGYGGTCAMGAALDAVGALPSEEDGEADHQAWAYAERQWPILLTRVVHPAVSGLRRWKLSGVIIDLNDLECWTREQIADFVQATEDSQTVADEGAREQSHAMATKE